MDAIRPTTTPSPAGAPGSGNTVSARADAAERLAEGRPPQLSAPTAPMPAAAPLRRSLPGLDTRLQGDVAGAQQALDFLEEVAGQLQSLKTELSAKIGNLQADEREIESQLRQLASTLTRRRQSAGDKLDAQLNYNAAAATQRFSVRNMTLSTLKSGSPQMLSFSLGGGSQAMTVNIEPGMSDEEIVQRFDRALAPASVRVGSDSNGKLIFTTPEVHYPAVRENLSILGRGRVTTEEEPGAVAPQRWGTSDTEALRLSLQEVVRALAQVRSSQAAASRELSAAASRAAMAPAPTVDMNVLAQDFVTTATEPNYDSLLAITSAMVGISRERVLALLGLH